VIMASSSSSLEILTSNTVTPLNFTFINSNTTCPHVYLAYNLPFSEHILGELPFHQLQNVLHALITQTGIALLTPDKHLIFFAIKWIINNHTFLHGEQSIHEFASYKYRMALRVMELHNLLLTPSFDSMN